MTPPRRWSYSWLDLLAWILALGMLLPVLFRLLQIAVDPSITALSE